MNKWTIIPDVIDGTEEESKPLNRQARLQGNLIWNDMGAVSIKDAAIHIADAFSDCPGNIEVRDESEPDTIYTLRVERVVSYRVTGLRGGE